MAFSLPSFAGAPFYKMSNAFGFTTPIRAEISVRLVYNALYRYNERLEPVPDLAAEPCVIASDQVTIRCSLVEATFHNGTPLTAADVVFTYELARRHPECLFGFGTCLDALEKLVLR
jgi:ABC-type transport system substrate-binding protein